MNLSSSRNFDSVKAQLWLGNRFQELYLWQEVADRDLEVSRIENLLYGCFSHDDEEAMIEADRKFMAKNKIDREG